MCDAVCTHEDDAVAILLRDWLTAPTRASRRNAQGSDVFARCMRAIDAFIKKEKLRTLYAAPTDLFPLPEEIPGDEAEVDDADVPSTLRLPTTGDDRPLVAGDGTG